MANGIDLLLRQSRTAEFTFKVMETGIYSYNHPAGVQKAPATRIRTRRVATQREVAFFIKFEHAGTKIFIHEVCDSRVRTALHVSARHKIWERQSKVGSAPKYDNKVLDFYQIALPQLHWPSQIIKVNSVEWQCSIVIYCEEKRTSAMSSILSTTSHQISNAMSALVWFERNIGLIIYMTNSL